MIRSVALMARHKMAPSFNQECESILAPDTFAKFIFAAPTLLVLELHPTQRTRSQSAEADAYNRYRRGKQPYVMLGIASLMKESFS
jgi:hypothetical protein